MGDEDHKKRRIQKIFYYVKSLQFGHKYIWQSFPRALELWFEFNEQESDCQKINDFVLSELDQLALFKIATVLQILLSRFAHKKEQVREIIIHLLAKLAIAYPGQSAWWIFHFLHFESEGQTPQNRRQSAQSKFASPISRKEFANSLICRIKQKNGDAYNKIMMSERIFTELKKLSEKNMQGNQQSQCDMPQFLVKLSESELVMPIQENLSP